VVLSTRAAPIGLVLGGRSLTRGRTQALLPRIDTSGRMAGVVAETIAWVHHVAKTPVPADVTRQLRRAAAHRGADRVYCFGPMFRNLPYMQQWEEYFFLETGVYLADLMDEIMALYEKFEAQEEDPTDDEWSLHTARSEESMMSVPLGCDWDQRDLGLPIRDVVVPLIHWDEEAAKPVEPAEASSSDSPSSTIGSATSSSPSSSSSSSSSSSGQPDADEGEVEWDGEVGVEDEGEAGMDIELGADTRGSFNGVRFQGTHVTFGSPDSSDDRSSGEAAQPHLRTVKRRLYYSDEDGSPSNQFA